MTVTSIAEALSVEGLSVTYHGSPDATPALREVTFTVPVGQSIGVIGESGSGKTTLAMTLAGFEVAAGARVNGGSFTVLGKRYEKPTGKQRFVLPTRRPGVSMIFQDAMSSLDPLAAVSVQAKRVLASQGIKGREAADTVRSALLEVGIGDPERVEKLHPYEISGGMRQRVMVAVALLSKPKLLIADEPTSALDVGMTALSMDLISATCKSHGITLFLVTHDLHVAQRYADWLLVLRAGQVVEFGRTEDVSARPRSAYARELFACVPDLRSYTHSELTVVAS
ncbi:hypothetical protein BH10ACT9_BH10ACT9_17320 [soil metagenome]